MPRFDTPQPITADITLPVGELAIVAGHRTDTVVTIKPRKPNRSADVGLAEQTAVSFEDGRLSIEAPSKWRGLIGPTASIDVTVELPAGSEVRAVCSVGSIRTEGPLGRCDLRAKVGNVRAELLHGGGVKADVGEITIGTSDGPLDVTANVGVIRAAELRAPTTMRSAHGGITVRSARDRLEVSSSSGSIDVDRAEGAVTAKTSYGKVRLGCVMAGTIRVDSSYGELEVGVAHGVPVWLDASSGHGVVRNQLDASAPPADGESFVELRARTQHGDVIVHRSSERVNASRSQPQDTL